MFPLYIFGKIYVKPTFTTQAGNVGIVAMFPKISNFLFKIQTIIKNNLFILMPSLNLYICLYKGFIDDDIENLSRSVIYLHYLTTSTKQVGNRLQIRHKSML